MNRKILFIIICILTVMLCGCASSDAANVNEYENEHNEDYITVGFSQLGSESFWRAANTKSVQESLSEENGFSLEFNNARQKQENQIKAIRGFISQRVDYIAFSPVTEEGWDTVLKEAKDAGIPVILVDRKIRTQDSSLYTTWVGSDAVAEGRRAGEWLERHLSETGRNFQTINIVTLMGNEGSSVTLGRRNGFQEICKNHTNWKMLEQQYADFTTAKAKEVMTEYIEKYDTIDVVVSQNDDMTFGAIDALKEAGLSCGVNGDVILISFDAVHQALELVSQGVINVDVECNPEEGPYIEDIIKRLERGESVEKENIVDEQVFTQKNVDLYIDDRSY